MPISSKYVSDYFDIHFVTFCSQYDKCCIHNIIKHSFLTLIIKRKFHKSPALNKTSAYTKFMCIGPMDSVLHEFNQKKKNNSNLTGYGILVNIRYTVYF